ncbi:hypothetical protein [Lysobacter gummosus]|uniref:hypothetical protein n=1 Tax=Lysobacter gummosus TaxID=262324 RepID=UPI003624E67D
MQSKTALLTIAVILVPNADHGLPSPAPITRRPRRHPASGGGFVRRRPGRVPDRGPRLVDGQGQLTDPSASLERSASRAVLLRRDAREFDSRPGDQAADARHWS